MAPVAVKEVNCDVGAYKCIGDLVSSFLLDGLFMELIFTLSVMQEFGDGKWVAAWSIYTFRA
jgi:hypothetical protein